MIYILYAAVTLDYKIVVPLNGDGMIILKL